MGTTRGVFAIITIPEKGRRILINERADGKGCDLPGGGVKEGETDAEALRREVLEETGYEVHVARQVGGLHIAKDNVAVAYACVVTGGTLIPTKEAPQHHWVTEDEILGLDIVGPTDRMGRMKRMIYDGLSLLREPECLRQDIPEEFFPIAEVRVSQDGLYLVQDDADERRQYRRLDPHSLSGFVEPKPPQ